MQENKKTTDELESIENKLYNSSHPFTNSPRHNLVATHNNIPREWASGETSMNKPKKKKHLMYSKRFRQIFFVGIIFFLSSVVFAGFTFFKGSATVSNSNIDIVVLGNSFVDGGEELPLQIKVANRNKTSIEIADMLVEYSKGAGGDLDMVRERVSLGEIKAGDIVEDIVTVSFFGEQGTVRNINFTLEYRIANSNAIFIKEYSYPVTIATSPIDMKVSGPENILSNQQFTTSIEVFQNSTEITQNMMVVANYPSGFKFENANPKPNFGNDTWLLGDLAPGASRTIEIEGSIKAVSGEEKIITIIGGSQDSEDEQEIGVQFVAVPFELTIGAPFVSADLFVSGSQSQNMVISPTDDTSFSIVWENKLASSISNLEIEAVFSGSAFDPNRVTVNQGFFNNQTNTIIWNGTNNNNLKSISPGQTGNLSFSLIPKSGVLNGTINVSIHANGVPIGQGTMKESVKNIYTGTIKLNSDVSIGGKVLYNEGPFTNSGQMPPIVSNETTYTIEWSVVSSTSNLKELEFRAELPSYVSWKNETHPLNENISYNSNTREVVWKKSNLTSSTIPHKAYFKVGFVPTSSHIGLNPSLISSSNMSAIDVFTGSEIKKSLSQMTTSLFADSGYNSGNDKVSQ